METRKRSFAKAVSWQGLGIVTMLAPQANNNRFGSKEKKLKATLKFSAAFKTKVSCAGASGAGLSCRWLTASACRWT